MPRSVRIEYGGAIYHVMCRGDRREAIFRDEEDRKIFLTTLAQMCRRTGARLQSYVLMSNHYHLLLETPEPNLVAGMKWFQGTYTQRHNARHRLCGHLFQGRYKAIPVETESPGYFAAASEYIHLNPVRAGLLNPETPELLDYQWSSYPEFVQKARLPEWLQRERVFGGLDLLNEGSGARRRYHGWMAARTRAVLERTPTADEAEQWRRLRRGWYLGSDTFRDRLMGWASGTVSGRKPSSYVSKQSLQAHDERAAIVLLEKGLSRLELTLGEVTRMKKSDVRKQGLAWLMKSQTVVSDEWICQRLQMGHRTNVSRALSALHSSAQPQQRNMKRILHACTD